MPEPLTEEYPVKASSKNAWSYWPLFCSAGRGGIVLATIIFIVLFSRFLKKTTGVDTMQAGRN